MVSCVSVACVICLYKDELIIWFMVFDVSSVALIRNDRTLTTLGDLSCYRLKDRRRRKKSI